MTDAFIYVFSEIKPARHKTAEFATAIATSTAPTSRHKKTALKEWFGNHLSGQLRLKGLLIHIGLDHFLCFSDFMLGDNGLLIVVMKAHGVGFIHRCNVRQALDINNVGAMRLQKPIVELAHDCLQRI
jgi:hypothetical protein